jgi:hypothetical protein
VTRIAFSIGFVSACSSVTLPGALGDQCALNSDCDAPLVCGLGFCRVECASARDCPGRHDCVYDNEQRGFCQLLEELSCTRNSDCPGALVCTRGECTNVCNCTDPTTACEDCPPGAACIDVPDGKACFDSSTQVCIYNSDCRPDGGSGALVCAPDRRCRDECRSDLDCRNGESCEPVTYPEGATTFTGLICEFGGTAARPDAGLLDGG